MPRQAKRRFIAHEYRDSDGYWIELKPGYRVIGDAHGIVEDSKQAAYDKLDLVRPCDCDDCQAQPSYQKRKE